MDGSGLGVGVGGNCVVYYNFDDDLMILMNQVLEWLDEIGFPTVRQEVEVGECLSKAELYKHHFETGFHSVAQVQKYC